MDHRFGSDCWLNGRSVEKGVKNCLYVSASKTFHEVLRRLLGYCCSQFSHWPTTPRNVHEYELNVPCHSFCALPFRLPLTDPLPLETFKNPQLNYAEPAMTLKHTWIDYAQSLEGLPLARPSHIIMVRPLLLGWRPSLVGWRPLRLVPFAGGRPSAVSCLSKLCS